MPTVALYARVSTADQDPERQLTELREYARDEYPDADLVEYVDVTTGSAAAGGEEYQRLRSDVADGAVDVVVVHELSRLSRLGGGAIHDFIQHALEHDTSVRDLEVGLAIDVEDDVVDRAVSQLIANVMGDLARIEHKQKLRRIESGIEAAQDAGKWTGRPPRGFQVEDGYLHVDAVEFLETRAALERVVAGEAVADVAEATGVPASTLRYLRDERLDLYFYGEPEDDRVDAALEDVRPLDDPAVDPPADLNEQVRAIVRDELGVDETA